MSLRILYMSNSTWSSTGYGTQSKQLVDRLINDGHQVAQLPYWGYDGAKAVIDGRTYYPKARSPWGDDALQFAALDWQADIVITLMDVFVWDQMLGASAGIRLCPWLPVDHYPVPEIVTTPLRHAYRPIAMSRFGQHALLEHGIWADYAPHGIETQVYRPEKSRQAEFKRMLGFPEDCFLVGMVAANKGFPARKAFAEAFEAFADFNRKVPTARLFTHTQIDRRHEGIDLAALARNLRIPPDNWRFPTARKLQIGFDANHMRRTFNAFDVLLSPSYGEGFGLPIMEAQACGTPVIVNNFSSMPELAGPGWRVTKGHRFYTLQNSWQVMPDVADITRCLHEAYERLSSGSGREDMIDQSRSFALGYDADRVFDAYWRPWLAMIEAETAVRTYRNPAQRAVSVERELETVGMAAGS